MELSSLPPFRVSAYALWSPQASSNGEWLKNINNLENVFKPGELPSVSFLPIALRKKLSPITKVSCFLLNEIIIENKLEASKLRLILSSRFGESDNTIQLLRSIRDDEPTSPMAFSRSVHNSALGIFSIATNNKTLSTSVSAGEKSVTAGLIEAVIQLYSRSEIEEVVYVYAEEKMPEDYYPKVFNPVVPFGFVCLLRKSENRPNFCLGDGEDEAMIFIQYLLTIKDCYKSN